MKKLKHTKAPITQANSTATMDKINEIICVIKGISPTKTKYTIPEMEEAILGMSQDMHIMAGKINKLENKVDKLEDEVSMKDE